ncbi:APC family permease [Methanospirillum lacunae]|uniref:Amino acid permease n=1 Tax=Methanospirillum lacunae TaxID=668570 RepID=A0A2V2NG29_9EURY|nr:amino acid permease [Methanospirillum lacunae]PWR74273.1 amino acid permease [Methanospirillum lacunae]
MNSQPYTQTSLPKTASLNLKQIIALYIGSVLGSGILLLPGLTAELAGPASLLAWLIMSLLAIPMALTMGFLSIKLPNAGGVSYFVSRAYNPAIGSLVGYYFLLSAIMAVPVIALTGAGYTCNAFGLGDTARIPVTICILTIGLISNYLGMKLTGQIQLAVVVATIGILVGAVLGSIHSINLTNLTPFLPHGWMSVGHSATLIFWCFLGWEAISHVTEEFENPRRDVLKGTIIASVLISILYLATVAAVIGTHSYGPGISEVSLIHLIGIAAGQYGMYIAGFITLFITIAPSIAYIGAASRLAYTLSQSGSAPRALSRISPRFLTPVGGLYLLIACFACILLVYSTGIVSLATLIQIPNATFILTYLGGSAAGLILLKDNRLGLIVSGISFLLTGVILLFVGWAIIWPVLVTVLWWIYRKITILDLQNFYKNRI